MLKLTEAEANAMCAERIFAWEWWTFLGNSYLVPAFQGDVFSAHPGIGWKRLRIKGKEDDIALIFNDYRHLAIPNYCSDPAATAMLRAKLAEKWHSFTLTRMAPMDRPDIDEPFEFLVEGRIGGDSTEKHFAEAATEGRATVMCALKSVGVEAEISAS